VFLFLFSTVFSYPLVPVTLVCLSLHNFHSHAHINLLVYIFCVSLKSKPTHTQEATHALEQAGHAISHRTRVDVMHDPKQQQHHSPPLGGHHSSAQQQQHQPQPHQTVEGYAPSHVSQPQQHQQHQPPQHQDGYAHYSPPPSYQHTGSSSRAPSSLPFQGQPPSPAQHHQHQSQHSQHTPQQQQHQQQRQYLNQQQSWQQRMSRTVLLSNHEHGLYRKIFVKNISFDTSEETLWRHFEHYGAIEDVVIVYDRAKKKSRGYGFVLYFDQAAAQRALQNPIHVLDARETEVSLAVQEQKGGPSPASSSSASPSGYSPYGGARSGPPTPQQGYVTVGGGSADWSPHGHQQHQSPSYAGGSGSGLPPRSVPSYLVGSGGGAGGGGGGGHAQLQPYSEHQQSSHIWSTSPSQSPSQSFHQQHHHQQHEHRQLPPGANIGGAFFATQRSAVPPPPPPSFSPASSTSSLLSSPAQSLSAAHASLMDQPDSLRMLASLSEENREKVLQILTQVCVCVCV
jgi:hypothetical protein